MLVLEDLGEEASRASRNATDAQGMVGRWRRLLAGMMMASAIIAAAPPPTSPPPPDDIGAAGAEEAGNLADTAAQGRAAAAAEAEAATGNRAAENAVRNAGDAFGTSIGRETIGLYNSSSVRGFSPTAAGNVRIDSLYFDQVWALNPRLRRTTNIRVGLSALGIPFPAPTGIVDYGFRRPGDNAALSVLGSINQWGNASLEVDGNVPVSEGVLSLGLGGALFRDRYYNGTEAGFYQAAIAARFTPGNVIEVVPFWVRSHGFDETGPVYVPGGDFLPPPIPRRQFIGPDWARYRGTAINYGVLASADFNEDWLVRLGLFRSLFDDSRSFSNLLVDLQPDGTANQLIIADPPIKLASTSGELRLTRQLAEGPRRHLVHLSLRGRAGDRRFDGSEFIDLGPTTITGPVTAPKPRFNFTEQQQDEVRQGTVGLAYEGRWAGVGELSLGIQKTSYRKRIGLPGREPVATDASPVLFNANAAIELTPRLVAYGGYVTGLEESGIAPDNAANRNEALPAINTRQFDAGLRYLVTDDVRLVAGVFDIRKPYFNLDEANRFTLLGDVINQGIEASIAGAVNEQLSIVAGAVLLRPQVTGEGVALGRVGPRPVGAISNRIEFNADWRTGFAPGLSFDISASYQSAQTATRDNAVSIPPRTLIDLGSRYSFRLAGNAATLRVSISNILDAQGFTLQGAGAYDILEGRLLSAYLTVDID
jgi:iron complex outermembrane receptor protein